MHIFEYLEKDRKLNEIFSKGMGKSSTINAMAKILEMYNGFEGVKEVGDALGETLCMQYYFPVSLYLRN